MPREQEIIFQTYSGVTYQVESTTDWLTWKNFRAPIQGDGTMKSIVFVPANEPEEYKYFRVRQSFSGMEPLYFRAITSWDGSVVTLEWNAIEGGDDPNMRYHLVKENVQPGYPLPLTVTEYRDTQVFSGQTYTYALPVYG